MAERFSLYDIVCPDLMTVSDLRRILHIGRNKDTVVGKGSKEANANDYYDLEKPGHYYILVQWNEHGKRFRKNCCHCPKSTKSRKNPPVNAGRVGAKKLSELLRYFVFQLSPALARRN